MPDLWNGEGSFRTGRVRRGLWEKNRRPKDWYLWGACSFCLICGNRIRVIAADHDFMILISVYAASVKGRFTRLPEAEER